MKGTVIKSTGSWYDVLLENGDMLKCRMKGKYRLIERRSSNPVTIGDIVEVEKEADENVGGIKNVLPRKNYIIRQSARNRTAEHIIAANLDQAVLMATITQPKTSTGFIDRFLVTATAYHIPGVIVFNKNDILNEDEKQVQEKLKNIYEAIGFGVLCISAFKEQSFHEVSEILKNKITLLSGHSGVGKSTLINIIRPGSELKTGAISKYHQKGTHTTTFAEMLSLPSGGFIIDTPGIKEFGILDFKPEEVSQYFPEMEKLMHGCRYNNCLHINEHDCAVKEGVGNGCVSESRYISYLSIIEEIQSEKKIYD